MLRTSPDTSCAKNDPWLRCRRSPQASGHRPSLAHGGHSPMTIDSAGNPAIAPPPPARPKLLHLVRQAIRIRHYQPTNRASLRELDPALHLLPQRPAPSRNGQARAQRVPVAPRGEGARQRLDADAGPERPGLLVPARPGAGDRPARRRRPCQAARPPAGRSDPGRGEATAWPSRSTIAA